MPAGTADFPTPDSAARSPLAQRLFAVPEVAAVFLGADFVTVTKIASAEWQILKPAILGAIMEHFTAGEPVVHEQSGPAHAPGDGANDEVVAQIIELLDTRVRRTEERRVGNEGVSTCKSRWSPST